MNRLVVHSGDTIPANIRYIVWIADDTCFVFREFRFNSVIEAFRTSLYAV